MNVSKREHGGAKTLRSLSKRHRSHAAPQVVDCSTVRLGTMIPLPRRAALLAVVYGLRESSQLTL